MNEATNPSTRPHARDDEYVEELAQAMRRTLKRVADYAMQHDDAVGAANEALRLLRAEFLWRFELLRSRQRLPPLVVPQQLPPPSTASEFDG